MSTPEPSWAEALSAAETMVILCRSRMNASDEQAWAARYDVGVITQLLGLTIWRCAIDHNTAVADTIMDHPLLYLRQPELLDGPLPAEVTEAPRLDDGWCDPNLRQADRIMQDVKDQFSPGRGLGDTDDHWLAPHTVHSMLDQFAQEPGDPAAGPAFQRAHASALETENALWCGSWVPTDTDRALAATSRDAIRIDLEKQPHNIVESSWLARLRRIANGAAQLQAIDTTGAHSLLVNLLANVAGALATVATPLPHLDEVWNKRPIDQRLPYWERINVPLTLRAQIEHLECPVVEGVRCLLSACAHGFVEVD